MPTPAKEPPEQCKPERKDASEEMGMGRGSW